MSSQPPGGSPEPPPLDPARAGESNTEWLLGVMAMSCFLAILFTGLRTYTRVFLAKILSADDWVMLAATITSLGGMICFSIQGAYGMGKHREFIDDDDFTEFTKIGFFQGLISNLGGVGLLKISIALSLLRLAPNRWYRMILWGLIGFVIAYTLLAWGTMIWRCNPVAGYWDKSINPDCYPMPLFITFGLINTAFNIFTDVCFATIPIPIIWALQMKLKTRLYLIGVLSLGYGAVGMGIGKAYYQIGAGAGDRQFYHGVQFWGFLQLNVGIVAACAPTLKPLVGRALGFSSAGTYGQKQYYAGNGSSGMNRLTGRRTNNDGYIEHTSRNEYELDKISEDERKADSDAEGSKNMGVAVTIYGHGVSQRQRTGSEDTILGAQHGAGIMQTTEVSIQRDADRK